MGDIERMVDIDEVGMEGEPIMPAASRSRRCPVVVDQATGELCHAPSVRADPDGYCFVHSEVTAVKRDLARRLGGRKARYGDLVEKPGDSITVEDLANAQRANIRALWMTANTVDRARAMTAAHKVLADILIASDLEERLTRLEARGGRP